MGGKSSTSTQQVSIPPEVLARYNSVNATAEQAASQPFQAYNGEFVAPLSPTQQAGIANTNSAAGQAQPYYQTATNTLMGAQQSTSPYYQAATQALMSGMGQGAAGTQGAYGSVYGANAAAQPFQQAGAYNMGAAYAGAQPYNAAAGQEYGAGLAAAQPFNQQAAQGINQAYQGAQPYNAMATGLAGAGAQGVNAQQIGGQQIGQFMSPYIQSVLQGTEGMLNQQNQQAMSGQTGNAIMSGAFGGDRAGIAAANLAQQQQLANAQTYSGILNQGYGQALGAAQQQQGVNLGAAQANRAALQQASGQMLGIGQQGYAQGLGAAQQQAALGQQLFGQGQTAGQNLAALGQQKYGQGMGLASGQTGLGQQLFGQGMTNAQQQAALAQQQYAQGLGGSSALASLGQGIYGTGAQTAQQLAALGTGAQGASMAGAQAQLAAGQQQQQTQQARDQALYNQFLQQQSYPFQTAQFLANIAEGTGSLSGSTTTSTQPGGFFSDERLKENIKPIGKTNDGQTIYSYNYKGDHRTQIGLLAQEVEKHHPEAVGLSGGYKTVDYAKATHDAERHRRASGGGLVAPEYAHQGFADGGMPGFDPMLAQSMSAAETGMFGPYGTSGGLGGGHSRVPGATLPVGHLQTAGALPAQKSGLEQGAQMASMVGEGIKDYGAAKKAFGYGQAPDLKVDKSTPKIDTSEAAKQSIRDSHESIDPSKGMDLDGFTPSWRGGLRGGYAEGGMPYGEEGPGLNIPDEQKSAPQLATAQGSPGKGRSGMDDVMDVAKIAAMFMMKTGGRVGKAGGGAFDDEEGGADNDMGDGDTQTFVKPGGHGGSDPYYQGGDDTSTANYHASAQQPDNSDFLSQALKASQAALDKGGDLAGQAVKGTGNFLHDMMTDVENMPAIKKMMPQPQGYHPKPDTRTWVSPVTVNAHMGGQDPASVIVYNSLDAIPVINAAEAGKDFQKTSVKGATARGEGQLNDPLYKDLLKQVFAKQFPHMGIENWTDKDVERFRTDESTRQYAADIGREFEKTYTQDNFNRLSKLPMPSGDITMADMRAAHMLGASSTRKFFNGLARNPNAPITVALDEHAVQQNKFVNKNGKLMTLKQVYDEYKNQIRQNYPKTDPNAAPLSQPNYSQFFDAPRLPAPVKRPHHAAGGVAGGRPTFAEGGEGYGDTYQDTQHDPDQDVPMPDVSSDDATPQGGGLMGRAMHAGHDILGGLGSATKRYGESLGRGEGQSWIPLLSGIAAMGTAPTRNLGVALASGLGAGTQAYQKQQGYGLERQKTEANAELARSQVARNSLGVMKDRFRQIGPDQFYDKMHPSQPLSTAQVMAITNKLPGMTDYTLGADNGPYTPPKPTDAATEQPQQPTGGKAVDVQEQQTRTYRPTTESEVYGSLEKIPEVAQAKAAYTSANDEYRKNMEVANSDWARGSGQDVQYLERAKIAEGRMNQQWTNYTGLLDRYGKSTLENQISMKGTQAATQYATKNDLWGRATSAYDTIHNAETTYNLLVDPKGNLITQGGPINARKADFENLLIGAGFTKKFAEALGGVDPYNKDALSKMQAQLGTEAAASALSAPKVAEWQAFQKTVPGPELPAKVSAWIINNIIKPKAYNDINAYGAVRDASVFDGDSVQRALIDYKKNSPYYEAGAPPPGVAPVPSGAYDTGAGKPHRLPPPVRPALDPKALLAEARKRGLIS